MHPCRRLALKPKIVFLVMSAQQPAELVAQLADALAPHPVVVHHDFSKRGDFRLDHERVHLVPDPRQTGWGTWGFCEAILHGMRYCLDRFDFDYLQLLSPTCLPIRPVAEFEAHVAADAADVHADLIDLGEDFDARMTYAWRAYFPSKSVRQRVARRMTRWYFGATPLRLPRQSMEVLALAGGDVSAANRVVQRTAAALLKPLVSNSVSGSVYDAGLRPFVGSTWIGARRAAIEFILAQARDVRTRNFFAKLANADEHFFPTMLGNSPFSVASSNHWVSRFDKAGHPAPIGSEAFPCLGGTDRFFARKFSADPDDFIRQRVLRQLSRGMRVRRASDGSAFAGSAESFQ